MPRDALLKGRYSQPKQLYHVTLCTDKRHPLFLDFTCARIVVRRMRYLNEQNAVVSIAWVLMPDHLHWLFQLGEDLTLSKAVKNLKATSAIEVNAYLGQKGNVWQRGFYDHALRQEEDMKQVARYIIANPLRAGLVENIGDYPFWDAVWL